MNNRNYGTSGYRPTHGHNSHHNHEKRVHKLPSKNKKRITRVLKWLAGLATIALILAWLFLGDFRFLITRYPGIAGFPFGSRNYLVLFQNNYELRPTGGFISIFGELKFTSGIYKGIEWQDVYGTVDDHDFVEPPLVLSALLGDENYGGHTFRDANFDPDFTHSKDDLIEFYQRTNPDKRVDGIIAVDFHFVEKLLEKYEPIKVEGYELTEDNLFETLSAIASDVDRHNEESLASRKNISSPLFKKLLTKSIIFPWRAKSTLAFVAEQFNEKHALATFNRSGLEKLFAKRNWNGALPESNFGDFLVVNDANYGGMKSNRYLTRDIQYELDISNRKDVRGNRVITATTEVTLSHEGIYNVPLSGNYKGYLRTLVPLGSDILEGSEITETRDNAEVLGEIVEIEPGNSITYRYQYELPEYVWSENIYNLLLHKQPGTNADHYRVIVRAPQGMSFDSEQFDVHENLAIFETSLLSDTNLNFTLTEDTQPPRIISHEITGLNEITLEFNETVDENTARDTANYQVFDIDHQNGIATDNLSVDFVTVEGGKIILQTSGMSPQKDERYELEIRFMKDKTGNSMEEQPRIVTVIQKADYSSEAEPEPEPELEVEAEEPAEIPEEPTPEPTTETNE